MSGVAKPSFLIKDILGDDRKKEEKLHNEKPERNSDRKYVLQPMKNNMYGG